MLVDSVLPVETVPALLQHLIPALEHRLHHRCDALAQFYSPAPTTTLPTASSPRRRGHDPRTELTARVQADLARLTRNTAQLRAAVAEQAEGELEGRTAEGAAEGVGQLEVVLERHKLHGRRDYDDTTSRWLQAKALAASAKLRVLVLRVMVETYSPSNVAGLRQIKEHLDECYAQQHTRNQAIRERLRLYNAIGQYVRVCECVCVCVGGGGPTAGVALSLARLLRTQRPSLLQSTSVWQVD
jgi:hypothetical protein